MAQNMLKQLELNIDKKVEIHLKNGEKLRCIPQQYMEDEYESFLVETYESYGSYLAGNLVEIFENEIVCITPR